MLEEYEVDKIDVHGVWVKIIANIRDNSTQEVRQINKTGLLDEDLKLGNIEYMWEEGNYSCDCNRKLFFDPGVVHDVDCSDGKFSVNLINPKTKSVFYKEF